MWICDWVWLRNLLLPTETSKYQVVNTIYIINLGSTACEIQQNGHFMGVAQSMLLNTCCTFQLCLTVQRALMQRIRDALTRCIQGEGIRIHFEAPNLQDKLFLYLKDNVCFVSSDASDPDSPSPYRKHIGPRPTASTHNKFQRDLMQTAPTGIL